ncbi:MAG TPA: hypothetical protein VNQ56_19010 [Pseudolabrys sp.]|nr:hypothetical protein [Pseudolabrys sp.]
MADAPAPWSAFGKDGLTSIVEGNKALIGIGCGLIDTRLCNVYFNVLASLGLVRLKTLDEIVERHPDQTIRQTVVKSDLRRTAATLCCLLIAPAVFEVCPTWSPDELAASHARTWMPAHL